MQGKTMQKIYQTSQNIPILPKKNMNLYQAINNGLDQFLSENKNSYVFGEDVAFGGVFRCTNDLLDKHGPNQVFNTPLSEQGIVAFAIGLAVQGKYSIPEIQFNDYIFPAFDQIVNEAAKLRYRCGNTYNCGKLTIRTPCAAVGHGAMFHSQSNEAFFAHSPGLVLVVPRNPITAKGLLLSSLKDENPVIFFEPKSLYRSMEMDVPEEYYELELRKCEVVKEGNDLTVVSYGAQFSVCEQAVQEFEKQHGISIELIDLQTVYPFDAETIVKSVNKTGRLLISHEGVKGNGIASEVASQIMEKCFWKLEAPIERICGIDSPFLLTLENIFVPNKLKVLDGLERVMDKQQIYKLQKLLFNKRK